MARYQVLSIVRPSDWRPAAPDDQPPEPGAPRQVLAESDDLFALVRQAIDYNQASLEGAGEDWAVVAEPGVPGRFWAGVRLCTPLGYHVAPIWWPSGWEPQSPQDVPNCVWKAHGDRDSQPLTYSQAMAMVQGLNRQCMDQPGARWYVAVAVEHEPISRTVTYDPAGTETTVAVRRLHVLRGADGGRGDCAYCPAHGFPCAQEDWRSLEQVATESRTRTPAGQRSY